MAPLSASELEQYYKWTAIKFVALIVAFGIYYKFGSKKYGVTTFVVFLLITYAGIMYFRYKDGYIPLKYRIWWTQQ